MAAGLYKLRSVRGSEETIPMEVALAPKYTEILKIAKRGSNIAFMRG